MQQPLTEEDVTRLRLIFNEAQQIFEKNENNSAKIVPNAEKTAEEQKKIFYICKKIGVDPIKYRLI
ncbi:MAG: hypothetical protein EBX41_00870 [Chitinophagia bacterium]|nr:hypothetical protein [Chitinophagia bacterium]